MVGNGGADVLCYIAVDTSAKNIERHSTRLGEAKHAASCAGARVCATVNWLGDGWDPQQLHLRPY